MINREERDLDISKIQEEQANLRALIENIAEEVWSVDRHLNLITFNRRFFDNPYLKNDFKPQENRPIQWLPEYSSMWEELHRRALSGNAYSLELIFQDRFYEASFRPIKASHGIVGVTVSCKEITDKKLVQNSLLEAKKLAEKALKTKGEFLANMSHELRTPLNAIIGYSEMLFEAIDEGGDPNTMKGDVNRIHKAGKHLLSLIEEILDLSRIESGNIDLQIQTISVSEFLEEISLVSEAFMLEKQNTFEWFVDPSTSQMKTDASKLRQILLHLLSNAGKFTRNGKVTLSVFPHNKNGSPWIKFQIADTGIGIPKERQAQIFDYFTQVDMAPTRKEGGTGVGLAITRRYCEALGGEIGVESEIGRGTLFTVLVPCNLPRKEV